VEMNVDLTKSYPRSVHEKMLGLVQLARTIDKAKAKLAGKLGEYNYDCPMDKGLFAFLGITGDELLEMVRTSKDDRELEERLRPIIARKTPEEIERWNHEWVTRKPEGEAWEYFVQARNQIAPDRTDVTTWADLLDLDEKRPVPVRTAA